MTIIKTRTYLLMITILSLGSCTNDASILNLTKSKKLDYYTETFSGQDLGFEPQTKVKYEYDKSDRLIRYRIFSHNPDTKVLEEQSYFDLTYSSNRVSHIAGFSSTSAEAYIEYLYEYFDNGSVSGIVEINHNAEVTTKADFIYDTLQHETSVIYRSSNGSSFEYKFHNENDNILSDKTLNGSELCNEGILLIR